MCMLRHFVGISKLSTVIGLGETFSFLLGRFGAGFGWGPGNPGLDRKPFENDLGQRESNH